jgi:hypothetical protein
MAVLLAVGLSGVVVVLLASSDDDGNGNGTAEREPLLGPTRVRGCRERVEGGRLRGQPVRDTIVGPVAFASLPDNYRIAARPDPARRDPPPPGYNAHPFKALVLVSAGKRVTLIVPRSQRAWMQLFYVPPGKKGTWRARLQACRRFRSRSAQQRECGWTPYTACRWRNTQFNGSIYVDFDHAPDRGRCAELIVRVGGIARALRARVFQPSEGACG